MTGQTRQHPWAAVAAATVLTLPLGSVYAFSVFLRPIEQELGTPRSALSFVFGLATIGFTIGSVLAPWCYRLAAAPILTLLCAMAAAFGIFLSATAHGLIQLLIGYGIVFGIGGGAAYIVLQQGVNLLVNSRKGLVNGYLVGLFPAGAMLAAPVFNWTNERFGYRWTMAGLALTLLAAGLIAALLIWYAGARLTARQIGLGGAPVAGRNAVFARLWLVFFLAAAAGLTVLSQAKEIVVVYGGSTATALAATTAITGAIACARVCGGFLVDRFPIPFVSGAAHVLALSGTIMLTLWPTPAMAAFALGMIGVGYGFVSGSTAGGIAIYWPPADYGKIAGRIYVAWCIAAISLPVLAGHLYDLTHTYAATMIIAGIGNLLGIIVALGLPRHAPRPGTAATTAR
jgi:OFA family oxalate/formate antiporter-like MFS transporter